MYYRNVRSRYNNKFMEHKLQELWLPEKESHIVFTWPFLHFLTLTAAVAARLLF